MFLNGTGGCKGQMQLWTEHEQTVNEKCYLKVLTRFGNLFGGKHSNSALTSGFSTMTMPLRKMR
jgi:hypothetical protein